MFGGRCKILRGLLCVGVGGLLAFGIAPCNGLRVRSGSVRFGLTGFGHILFRLLLNLLQAGAEALALFVQLLLISLPVIHCLDVRRHQGFAIGEVFTATDPPIQKVSIEIARIEIPFQLVVLVAQFALLSRLDGFLTFQHRLKGQQFGAQLFCLAAQTVATVFQVLNLVHVFSLCSIRLWVG
ncbi:hypothetical protein D3C73_802260 [compost metagenome]